MGSKLCIAQSFDPIVPAAERNNDSCVHLSWQAQVIRICKGGLPCPDTCRVCGTPCVPGLRSCWECRRQHLPPSRQGRRRDGRARRVLFVGAKSQGNHRGCLCPKYERLFRVRRSESLIAQTNMQPPSFKTDGGCICAADLYKRCIHPDSCCTVCLLHSRGMLFQ